MVDAPKQSFFSFVGFGGLVFLVFLGLALLFGSAVGIFLAANIKMVMLGLGIIFVLKMMKVF